MSIDELIDGMLSEGMGSNPTVNKAYGVNSFAELAEKIKKELPASLLKKTDGWILEDSETPRAPVALVILKDMSLVSLGMQRGELVLIRSRAIFPLEKMGS